MVNTYINKYDFQIYIDCVPYPLEFYGGPDHSSVKATIRDTKTLFTFLRDRDVDPDPSKYAGVLLDDHFYYVDHLGDYIEIIPADRFISVSEVQEICKFLLYDSEGIGYECLMPVPN
jgi:hypothetical protein